MSLQVKISVKFLNGWPVVGRVRLCFASIPQVTMSYKLYYLPDMSLFPGVDNLVVSFQGMSSASVSDDPLMLALFRSFWCFQVHASVDRTVHSFVNRTWLCGSRVGLELTNWLRWTWYLRKICCIKQWKTLLFRWSLFSCPFLFKLSVSLARH